jgi:hypothetical protein
MKTRVKIAQEFRAKIARLSAEQDKLYHRAIKALNVSDTTQAWDYLRGNTCGYSSFEELLRSIPRIRFLTKKEVTNE